MIAKVPLMLAIAGNVVAISRFQRLKDSYARLPRALPWAITFRAFGAGGLSFDTASDIRWAIVMLSATRTLMDSFFRLSPSNLSRR